MCHRRIRQGWTLQEILDEAAIDEETNQQATEMEKKISHEEKGVKRTEENPDSKPCGRCGHKHTQKCPAQQDKTRYPKDSQTRRDQEDEEIPEDQTIVMGKSTKCRVTRKSSGSAI